MASISETSKNKFNFGFQNTNSVKFAQKNPKWRQIYFKRSKMAARMFKRIENGVNFTQKIQRFIQNQVKIQNGVKFVQKDPK